MIPPWVIVVGQETAVTVAFARVLPAPMLARPAELPRGSGYAFEVKWDGFRALVSTVDRLIVRSRRGWDMTHGLPELEQLPRGLILDGELISLGDDGLPSFPRLSERVLHGHKGIAVSYVIFDVLACDGHSVMDNSYAERRALLERPRARGTRVLYGGDVRGRSGFVRRGLSTKASRESLPNHARARTAPVSPVG